jgi:hypothetical protein
MVMPEATVWVTMVGVVMHGMTRGRRLLRKGDRASDPDDA